MIRMGLNKTGPCTNAQSERHERAQRQKERQIFIAKVIQRTAEVIFQKALHLTVQEEVMVIHMRQWKRLRLLKLHYGKMYLRNSLLTIW